MEQQLYDRPRERIRFKGAQSLSVAELLQVVIGSGSKNNSVAKLARSVSAVLANHTYGSLYDALCAVPGVGNATACRIMAALQLSKAKVSNTNHTLSSADVQKIAMHKQQKVYCFALDKQQNSISTHSWRVKDKKATNSIVKQLFEHALSVDAHSVVVVVGYQKQSLKLGVFEIGLVNSLRELAPTVQVVLRAVVAIGELGGAYLHGGSGEYKLT